MKGLWKGAEFLKGYFNCSCCNCYLICCKQKIWEIKIKLLGTEVTSSDSGYLNRIIFIAVKRKIKKQKYLMKNRIFKLIFASFVPSLFLQIWLIETCIFYQFYRSDEKRNNLSGFRRMEKCTGTV